MAEDITMYGEPRKKTGRKPITDRKVTVSVYPRRSRIEAHGIEAIREIAINAIEKEYFKQLKTA